MFVKQGPSGEGASDMDSGLGWAKAGGLGFHAIARFLRYLLDL